MNYIKTFENFSSDIEYLLEQINGKDWKIISDNMFNDLKDEGWIGELTEVYGGLSKDNFTYIELDILESDEQGLIEFDDNTLNKFNDFDVKLKENQEYPFKVIDMIDYDNGKVYIIKFQEN
jgi:hypothetical protein